VDSETNWIDAWLGREHASCYGVNLVFRGFGGFFSFSLLDGMMAQKEEQKQEQKAKNKREVRSLRSG
jgi:hypothetical protein